MTKENRSQTASCEFAKEIAWLASPENKDDELRQKAIEILDKLCLLEHLASQHNTPKHASVAGRGGSPR